MTGEFKLALSLSLGLHVAAFSGIPVTAPPVFDVERGPTSVELYLVTSPAADPHPVLPQEVVVTPEPTPSVAEERTPEPQTVIASDEKGAQVDVVPSYLRNPPPVYSRAARAQGYEGTVRLDVEVLESGRCGTVNILTSSGYEVLDEAAMAAVRDWLFKPARRWRRPVPFWVEIPITFQLKDEDTGSAS